MTNAPTTRETADHAELARLAEDALIPMPEKRRRSWFNRQNRFRDAFTPAVCSALLSEIAALRGARDAWKAMAENGAGGIIAHIDRATQAERQRDEAVGHLTGMLEAYRLLCDDTGKLYYESASSKHAAACAFLANQGAASNDRP